MKKIKDTIVKSKIRLETLQNLFQISHKLFNIHDSSNYPSDALDILN